MKEDQERTPLRTILTNFLNHIENLEARRSSEDSYENEFQELKLFSESIKGTKQYSCSEGEKEVNRKKNRYKDILPFDISRVSLNEYAGIPGSDYINANFIKGASGSPAYIASQGPLPHTVNDFWRMVVQCEVQVIVMACNEEEAGKHKCENYWVEGDGEEKQFGMVSIRLIKASTVCPDFSVRTMRLKYTNNHAVSEERTVCQFHYSAWPDHGVPPLVRPLLDMVRLVRDTQASETLPVLVHCSAGCGRTGTICAIDYVWGLLRAGKLTKDFSLLSLVREMRKQRIAMVQTKEQYVLVHQAVRELFKEQLRMIDSHPYENIDCNGLPLIKPPSPQSEPTYDTISRYQTNNISEEKQDEKEKETTAPPIPQKKRFILSSKQEKEVENLSERQRLVEQAESSSESIASSSASGTSSGHRPRIAKLKSFFERNSATRESRRSPHIARSHSLGAVRNSKAVPSLVQPESVSVEEEIKEQTKESPRPIPYRGILRVPQITDQPVLPVKRSKSLRVLGTGDRYKLSIPAGPPPTYDIDTPSNTAPDKIRRLSLESNIDEMREERKFTDDHEFNQLNRNSQDYLPVGVVDAIVAGLGVRERRNSFRQAMNRAGPEQNSKNQKDYEMMWATPRRRPGLLRSYTSIDMRTVHAQSIRQNVTSDVSGNKSNSAPAKPILRPKPFVYNKGPKSMDKSLDVSANKFQSSSLYSPRNSDQQRNTSLNQSEPLPLSSSYQNNSRPVPRSSRATEIKQTTPKQQSSSSSIQSRTELTRQKDLSYPFKTEYINANRGKILQPVGHSVLPTYSGGSTQIITHHSKSSSTPKEIQRRQLPLDPRFSDNSKEKASLKQSGRAKSNIQTNETKLTNQLDTTNRTNQDVIQNINIRHNQSSVEHKTIQNKPISQSQDLRSQQNFRQIQQVTSPNTHPEMVRKNSSNHQIQTPSTSRPVVYDSRSGKKEPAIVYGTRPKAPPPYLEASRQNIYNKSQIDSRKTSVPNSTNFDYDPRYVPLNVHDHHLKIYSESRQMQQDGLHVRDSNQFYDVKKNSSQIDDRLKSQEIRDARNYVQFNNPQLYPHMFVHEMRSNPQSSQDSRVHEMRSNPPPLQETRIYEMRSNPLPLMDTRVHEMRSNPPPLKETRIHEMRPNPPLIQDSRVHEMRSQPLDTRVHEMRSNPPPLQDTRVHDMRSNPTLQDTRVHDMRSNPTLQDTRVHDMRSNPPLQDTRVHDLRSNPPPLSDTRVHEVRSNPPASQDPRCHEIRLNPPALQEPRGHEIRTNPPALQDTRNHEMRSKQPSLQDTRVHEMRSNPPPVQDSRSHEIRSNSPPLQDTRVHEIRSNPQPLQDTRQSKQPPYIHYTPNRNPQAESIYRVDKPQQIQRPPDDRPSPESETANHGVKLRRGSRDDLALCSNFSTPSRVKRHASVVMLRHSLIENSNSAGTEMQPALPLTVWNQGSKESRVTDNQAGSFSNKNEEDPWSGAVGVDLDQVAASIPLKDGTSTKFMRAALESLHLRKGTPPQTTENVVESKPATSLHTGMSSQPAQTFRKQQQYL